MYTRKSPFLVNKLRISIAISNSYVRLLEGMSTDMLKYKCVLAWTYDYITAYIVLYLHWESTHTRSCLSRFYSDNYISTSNLSDWPIWGMLKHQMRNQLSKTRVMGITLYFYIYNHVYIWYPPQNLCRLQFYWYLQWILYILAPILFRLNLRHQQWENWKTEFHRRSLGSILLLWNSVFQFFSSRLLLKGENPKSWKNWKTEFHRRSLGSILLLWNSVFQFFGFSVFQF